MDSRPRFVFNEVRGVRSVQLIYVGMEDAIHEADAGRLVRVLVWELDVDLPEAAGEGCCVDISGTFNPLGGCYLTLFRSLKADVELLPTLWSA